MIFRLTKRSQKKLSLKELVKKETDINKKFFKEWNVDIILLKNLQYFMLTEGKTFFTIIKPVNDIMSKDAFEKFIEKMFANILNDLIEDGKIDRLIVDGYIFAKTENNSLRRVQIEMKNEAVELLNRNENLFNINRMPVGRELRKPVDYFIEEISNVLLKDGRVYIEDVLNN